jgi:hypothetical protein
MSQGKLVQMADILPPLLPDDTGFQITWPVAAVLVAVLLFALLVIGCRLWRHPLQRLARDVTRGRISPRAAAHRLAQRLATDSTLRRELDRARFRRAPPSAAAVSDWIRRAGDGR